MSNATAAKLGVQQPADTLQHFFNSVETLGQLKKETLVGLLYLLAWQYGVLETPDLSGEQYEELRSLLPTEIKTHVVRSIL